MRIRLTGEPTGIFGASGEYPTGHEIDVKEAPAAWVGRYQVVGKDPAPGSAAINNEEPGPLDGNVEDLTAHIATITDADEVQRLLDAETAGKSRKGAIAVLEARRDELLA